MENLIKTDKIKEEKPEKGALVCPNCKNIFYKKHWHHRSDLDLKDVEIKEEICPACKMIEDHLYEGEIEVENVPDKYWGDMHNLIKDVGEKAIGIDPQHRIINIEEQGNGNYRITTTENQLAVRIGKKIEEAFKNANVDIQYSKEPYQVARVRVTF